MNALPSCRALVSLALTCLLALPLTAWGQPAGSPPAVPPGASAKEFVAVMETDVTGADKAQATAMTDRLREELLKTGKYILVEREQMNAILNEQAFQQTGCTSSECAVQVGKVLGVRKIISSRATKVGDNQWLLTGNITNVETAETERAVSVRYEGTFFALLDDGIAKLTAQLSSAAPPPSKLENLVGAGTAPAAKPEEPAKAESRSSKWWWIAGGAVAVAAVAAAAGSKSGGGSSSHGSGGSGCSSCTSVTAHW